MFTMKFPKPICDALDRVIRIFDRYTILRHTREKTWSLDYALCLNELSVDTMMRALVLGWRSVDQEEMDTRNLYDDPPYPFYNTQEMTDAYRSGMRDALTIHQFEYEWLTPKEEQP